MYLTDTFEGAFTIPARSSNRVNAGYEEQSDSLISGDSENWTPVGNFSTLLYHGANTHNWYNWSSHSRCQVDYNKDESFSDTDFPTSFAGAIGTNAGSYGGCTGSAPTDARTDW